MSYLGGLYKNTCHLFYHVADGLQCYTDGALGTKLKINKNHVKLLSVVNLGVGTLVERHGARVVPSLESM